MESPATAPGDARPHPVSGWAKALDDLESYVTCIEELLNSLASGHVSDHHVESGASWCPPEDLGALPEPLLPRARALLLRQRQLGVLLSQASLRNRRHRHRANAARDTAPAPAVYVDTAL